MKNGWVWEGKWIKSSIWWGLFFIKASMNAYDLEVAVVIRVVPALWELEYTFPEHVGTQTFSYRATRWLQIQIWQWKVLLAFKPTAALFAWQMLSQSLDLQWVRSGKKILLSLWRLKTQKEEYISTVHLFSWCAEHGLTSDHYQRLQNLHFRSTVWK